MKHNRWSCLMIAGFALGVTGQAVACPAESVQSRATEAEAFRESFEMWDDLDDREALVELARYRFRLQSLISTLSVEPCAGDIPAQALAAELTIRLRWADRMMRLRVHAAHH